MRTYVVLTAGALLLGGCTRHLPPGWQGYLEGDFVYVSSPLAGRLETLAVAKGTRVEAGAALFTLERASETAARREASDQLDSSAAHLADLKKGSRATEIAALQARLSEARAAVTLAQTDLTRQEALFHSQAISASDYDHARLIHEENLGALNELIAQLATAELGARPDAIAAASAEVGAARAALARADWSVDQKSQSAPRAALVYDTLYREGEFVAAGNPVLTLLPPENLKVRFFVPEEDFASLKPGDRLAITVPGQAAPLAAHVSYLSPQPEYTPPVLYNRDNRAKLVFLIEAALASPAARDLRPGLPVDVARAAP